MAYDFDIIVRGKGNSEILLICETKLFRNQVSDAERRLKAAMARLSCPLGLLLTPDILRIFVDRYTSNNPSDSIQLIGEFDSRELLQRRYIPRDVSQLNEQEFESAVQRWLENLPQTLSSVPIPDANLAGILATYVVPAIASGSVSAAAPRYF